MSTTRPCTPGDRGPEPSGASGMSDAGPSGPVTGPQVRSLALDGQSGVVPVSYTHL